MTQVIIGPICLRESLASTDLRVSTLANTILRLQHAIRGQFSLVRAETRESPRLERKNSHKALGSTRPTLENDGMAIMQELYRQLIRKISQATLDNEVQTFTSTHGLSSGQFWQVKTRLNFCMAAFGKRFINILTNLPGRPCWVIVCLERVKCFIQ